MPTALRFGDAIAKAEIQLSHHLSRHPKVRLRHVAELQQPIFSARSLKTPPQ
jgi:hypothetical protein